MLRKIISQILIGAFTLPAVIGLVTPFATQDVIASGPHFQASQSVDKEFANRGDTLTYTIKITNDGSTNLTSVFISENFSPYVTYKNGSTTATKGGTTISITDAWVKDGLNLGKLTPGQTVSVKLQAIINKSAPDNAFIETTAQVKSNELPNWVQCAAQTKLKVEKKEEPKTPSFKATKEVDKTKAAPGETLTYTINIVNNGEVKLTSVFLADTLPNQVTYISGSTSATKGTIAISITDAWVGDGLNLGTLEVGQKVSVTFKAKIKKDIKDWVKIENVAQVKTNELPNWVQCAATTMVEFEKGSPKVGHLKIFKFEDSNGNAVFNNDERGLPGFKFTIVGNGINKIVSTEADGVVIISDLPSGTYIITEQVPAGWKITTDNNIKVTVKKGELTEVRFGNKQVGKVLGKVTQLPDTGPGLLLALIAASLPVGIYLKRLKSRI